MINVLIIGKDNNLCQDIANKLDKKLNKEKLNIEIFFTRDDLFFNKKMFGHDMYLILDSDFSIEEYKDIIPEKNAKIFDIKDKDEEKIKDLVIEKLLNIDEIKYIALDLDGTLLDSNHDLMPKTIEALKEVQEKGIRLIIATGRAYVTLPAIAKQIDMDKHDGLIISSNGALVSSAENNEHLFEDKLDMNTSKAILRSLEDFDAFPFYWNEETRKMYGSSVSEAVIDTGSHVGERNIYEYQAEIGGFDLIEVDNLAEGLDFDLYKIMAVAYPDYLEENKAKIAAALPEDAYMMLTDNHTMEFAKKDVNKLTALQKYEIDLKASMAFGDSMNDLSMISKAKYGVAMGNAMDKVKEEAFYVTDSNNDDGIYKALKKFGLV